MNELCDKMGTASEAELEEYMEELGVIQDLLTVHDFYLIVPRWMRLQEPLDFLT